MNGVQTGNVDRDHRCQACGCEVTLRPSLDITLSWVFGFLFLPAVFPGIYFLLRARRWKRAWIDNPVVPDAPMPAVRYTDGPRARRCGRCGQKAVATHITRRRHNGIPTGTEYKFRCEGCDTEIITESAGSLILMALCAALVTGLDVAIWRNVEGSTARYGCGCGMALVGAMLLGLLIARIAAALRNPEI